MIKILTQEDFRIINNYPQKDLLFGIIIPPECSYSEIKQQIIQGQKIIELVKEQLKKFGPLAPERFGLHQLESELYVVLFHILLESKGKLK